MRLLAVFCSMLGENPPRPVATPPLEGTAGKGQGVSGKGEGKRDQRSEDRGQRSEFLLPAKYANGAKFGEDIRGQRSEVGEHRNRSRGGKERITIRSKIKIGIGGHEGDRW